MLCPAGTCLYLGGALVHANGHIYMVHSNRLYRFWLGDLYNATSFDIPTNFDTLMTQTNGRRCLTAMRVKMRIIIV